MVAALQQLDSGTGAQVAATDADDNKYIGMGANPLCGGLNALDLFGGFGYGQIQPAQEIVAGAVAFGELVMCSEDFLFQRQQIGQGYLTPHVRNINFNHK